MSESIAIMRSPIRTPTRTTQTTRETLRAVAAMDLREHFAAREPDAIAPVLDAIIDRRRAQSV